MQRLNSTPKAQLQGAAASWGKRIILAVSLSLCGEEHKICPGDLAGRNNLRSDHKVVVRRLAGKAAE